MNRALFRACQVAATRRVASHTAVRFNSTSTATVTQTSTDGGWWTPTEPKLKMAPMEDEEGKEIVSKVVNVAGVRPDGRSLKWFTEVRTAKVEGGYTFLLDGRGAQTQKEPLVVPSEALAFALSMEWLSQGKYIMPDSLPLTRLVTMAIDHMDSSRDRIIGNLMNTFDSDLACVRIEEEIFAKQKKTFTPMIDWFAEKFGYKPKVSILFGKLKHPPQLVEAVREYITSLDDLKLQALDHMTSATRSIVLSLYLAHGNISIDEGIKAARIEEDSQTATWGVIPGTHDVDRTEISTRMAVATLFWRLLDQK